MKVDVFLSTAAVPGIRATRVLLRFLLMTFVMASPLRGADVIVYVVGKNHHFDQSGTGAPTENPIDTWEAGTSVYPTSPGNVTGAAITLAGSGVKLSLASRGIRFEVSEYFDFKTNMDNTASNGLYILTVNALHDGSKTNRLALIGDAYPVAPHVTNYNEAQFINPATNFVLRWDPFASGTTNDFIILFAASAADDSGTNFFLTPLPNQPGALRGTNSQAVIPPGALPTNSYGYFKLAFLKAVDRNTNDYPGVTGYAGYGAVTTMGFVTLGLPAITQAPASITTNAGANVTFSVTATGGNLSYQWQKDGTNIAAATNSAYSMTGIRGTNAGSYTVIVRNSLGSASAVAFLTVVTGAPGSLDPDFNVGGAGANNFVRAIAVRPDGNIAVGGSFTMFNGVPRNRVTVLNANGATASTFNPAFGANNVIYGLAAQPDNKLIVGGSFTTIENLGYPGVGRYNPNGTLDTANFNIGTGANGPVLTIALQPDGKILLGGSFTAINNVSRGRVARLNADGRLDTNFVAVCDGDVQALAVQPDGRVLIAGAFGAVNGTNRPVVARLSAAGALDLSFNAGAAISYRAYSLALQSDGKVLVTGSFDNVDGFNPGGFMRLNSDGSRDTSYNCGTGAPGLGVRTVALHPDNRCWIGGEFSGYDGLARNRYVRVNPDGTADKSVAATPGANNTVLCLVPQADGKTLIGGAFTAVNGITVSNFARLNGDARPPIPSLSYAPSTHYAFEGEDASFYVSVACSLPVGFQWREDGMDMPGATNSWLNFKDTQSTSQGGYSVIAQSAGGSVTSSIASLFVLPQPQLLEGIAHRYTFSGPAGSTSVADSIGTAHGMLLTPATGDGFTGAGKLALTGSSGYLDLPNGIISGLTNLTIECWVTWDGPSNSQHQKIFDFGSSSGGEGNSGQVLSTIQLTPYSEFPNTRFFFSTNTFISARPILRTPPPPLGTETHYAVVYHAEAGVAKLYVNGRLVSMGGAPSPLRGVSDVNNWLGRANGTAPYYNGQFNEFRIYSTPLSAAAILNSYLAGPDAEMISFSITGINLVLSWPLMAVPSALECTTNLSQGFQPFSYTPVTNAMTGTVTVTIPTIGVQKLFRLHKL